MSRLLLVAVIAVAACGQTSPPFLSIPPGPSRGGDPVFPRYEFCDDSIENGLWAADCTAYCLPRTQYKILCHNSAGEPPHFVTDELPTSAWGRAAGKGCDSTSWHSGKMVLDDRIYIDRAMIDVQVLSTWEVPALEDCHPQEPPEKRDAWFFRDHPDVIPLRMLESDPPQ